MKIKAAHTEFIDVDIDPTTALQAVKEHRFRVYGFPGEYINSEGLWETDFEGHGSGYRIKGRPATDEEKEYVKAWGVILNGMTKT